MKTVLVTGANGFVGRALCRTLLEAGYTVKAPLRSIQKIDNLNPHFEPIPIGEIDQVDWKPILVGVDAVIHLAARVHQMQDSSLDPAAEYRRVNVEATRGLAEAAAEAGVHRFVFLSSIKVNGEFTTTSSFTEQDQPNPIDPYGVSKLEAEQVLQKMATHSKLKFVIIRTPLVYGPGVKANFAKLVSLVNKRVPFPFGSIQNQRSLIYVGNLVSALILSMKHEKAIGNTYLVSDPNVVSTAELIRKIAHAYRRPALVYPVPVKWIETLARLLGRQMAAQRLLSSLVVDHSKIKAELGWEPPFTMQGGLEKMVSEA